MSINYAGLSAGQIQFLLLLEKAPFLKRYWNFDTRSCDHALLDRNMETFSHGEEVIARFFLCLWMGDNSANFDLFEAVRTLDDNYTSIIQQWIERPFWP